MALLVALLVAVVGVAVRPVAAQFEGLSDLDMRMMFGHMHMDVGAVSADGLSLEYRHYR